MTRAQREWRVFGWGGHRSNTGTSHNQTREIVAARSMAEAARLAGFKSPRMMWNLTETGNEVEIAIAMHFPTRGCVCWKPLDERDPLAWKRDADRREKGETT